VSGLATEAFESGHPAFDKTAQTASLEA